MKEPPGDFATVQLVDALEAGWGFSIRGMEYVPVGFGAHHWRATTTLAGDIFVSLHDLDLVGRMAGERHTNLELLKRALGTARWLEFAVGLDFVLGPLPDRTGSVLRMVADNIAVHVYPWTDAEVLWDPDGEQTARLIARVHGVTERLPADLASSEDFAIPHRRALDEALEDLGTSWCSGPYADQARDELRRHAVMVAALLTFYERSAREAAGSRSEWVLTHGEPRGPNLIQTSDGHLRLVDWDTVMLAPRERDLWELPRNGSALGAYQALVDAPIDAQRMRMYEAWYALAELAVYLKVFRSEHVVDRNTAQSWESYLAYLPTRDKWPEL